MSDILNRQSGQGIDPATVDSPSVAAVDLKFVHFFRNAFIGLLSDLNAKLQLPTYMLSTGDQRYWDGTVGNKVQDASIDSMLIEAKNLVNVVPRVIVDIKQPTIRQQALTQRKTPIRLISIVDDEPYVVDTTMRRIPVDFSITLLAIASNWINGLDLYEHLLTKLYKSNVYSFAWAGVVNSGSYDFDISGLEQSDLIAHDMNANDCKINLPLTLHLQYPAINNGDNTYSFAGIIKDYIHNLELIDTNDVGKEQQDANNIGANITFNGGFKSEFFNLDLRQLSDNRICDNTGCKL